MPFEISKFDFLIWEAVKYYITQTLKADKTFLYDNCPLDMINCSDPKSDTDIMQY